MGNSTAHRPSVMTTHADVVYPGRRDEPPPPEPKQMLPPMSTDSVKIFKDNAYCFGPPIVGGVFGVDMRPGAPPKIVTVIATTPEVSCHHVSHSLFLNDTYFYRTL